LVEVQDERSRPARTAENASLGPRRCGLIDNYCCGLSKKVDEMSRQSRNVPFFLVQTVVVDERRAFWSPPVNTKTRIPRA
jgi:hypothetical protein